MDNKANSLVLGYWKIRGLGQQVRFLLEYLKLSYTEVHYASFEEWQKDKLSLGLDLPNLPYLLDQNKKITQTWAIQQYLCIKAGRKDLIGSNDDDQVKISMVYNEIVDIKEMMYSLVTTKGDFEKEREEALQGRMKSKLEALEKYLGKKEWICGSISICEFTFFEMMDELKAMYGDEKLSAFKGLLELHKRFSEIEEIKKF